MKTCLVVDDSSVIRKVARRILEGLDFQIVEAEDGEQALEACRRQLFVKVKGQSDILVCGIPYISPYNVNSILNPLLVQVMA